VFEAIETQRENARLVKLGMKIEPTEDEVRIIMEKKKPRPRELIN